VRGEVAAPPMSEVGQQRSCTPFRIGGRLR